MTVVESNGTAAAIDAAAIETFLDVLHPRRRWNGALGLSYLAGTSIKTAWPADFREAMQTSMQLAPDYDVYLNVALRSGALGEYERGGIAECVLLPALFADVDYGNTHDRQDLPADRDAALDLVGKCSLRPSMVIDSGYGLHVYWCTDEPVANETGRRLLAAWKRLWEGLAQDAGVHVDTAAIEITRMLRVGGTLNHKHDTQRQVSILHADSNVRYALAQITKVVGELPPAAAGVGGHWRKIERDRLGAGDRAALEALEALGGHSPYHQVDAHGDEVLYVTRPGKTAGSSASVGHIGPGVVKVFSESWRGLPQGVYDADQLRERPSRGHGSRADVESDEDAERDALSSILAVVGERRCVTGGSFALDAATEVASVWGEGDDVLWAAGEPTLIAGPTGIGKTTLEQHIILARVGLRGDVLGYPVVASDKRVLYIAADRPPQAARSLRRMVSEQDRKLLDERVRVWRGPLPYSLGQRPEVLLMLAEQAGADMVLIDSLKDVGGGQLSKEEIGTNVNSAFQLATAEGVDVSALHHVKKPQAGEGAPKRIDSVFGSTMITAGAGSVILLWGEPGDPVIELLHRKQPMNEVGPLTIEHDAHAGRLEISTDTVTPISLLARAPRGLTAQELAVLWFKKPAPNRLEVAKAYRRLESLANAQPPRAMRDPGARGGEHGGKANRYFAVDDYRTS